MHSVLIISTVYSQSQHIKSIVQKHPEGFRLNGTADNSVLGMSLIESTLPDLVIMPTYMNFWNAEDLINYLLPRGICPQFILLDDNPGQALGDTAVSKVCAVLPELPDEEALLLALGGAAESPRVPRPEQALRDQRNSAVQHSLEVMELLMGLIPLRTGEAQMEFGRLRVGRSDCWLLLGAPVQSGDEHFNFFFQPDNLEDAFAALYEVLRPLGSSEVCIYRESNLCILLSDGQESEPSWEQLIKAINGVLRPFGIPPLAFEVSDVPLPLERWHTQCRDLMRLREKRFFFSPACLQPKTAQTYQAPITQNQVREALSALSLSLQNLVKAQMVGALQALEDMVRHSMSTDLYSFVFTQLMVQYSRLRSSYGLHSPEEELAIPLRQFTGVGEAFNVFRELFLSLFDQLSSAVQSSNALIMEAYSYINQNLGDPIKLEAVAGHVHIHPTYLSRLFKKETGCSFSAYINQRRVLRAMQLLETQYKIIDIAGMVGFENSKYFSQVFRKQVGKTPQEYRAELRKVAAP